MNFHLHDNQGGSLYLNADERWAIIGSAATADRPVGTLCTVLYDTSQPAGRPIEISAYP